MVAIDPQTGEILAFWSFPTYDPNLLVEPRPQRPPTAKTLLEASPDKPLLARMYHETFFPGSTFKVVDRVGRRADRHGHADAAGLPAVTSYTPPQTVATAPQLRWRVLRRHAVRDPGVSCNTAFAQMGVDLGPRPR